MAEYGHWEGGVRSWTPTFTRNMNDWELHILVSFFKLLYSSGGVDMTDDRVLWVPSKKGKFEVSSCYKVLLGTSARVFPWKKIWKTKAPPRVAFFI